MSPHDRNPWMKQMAADAGFDLCGVAPCGPIPRASHLRRWLDAGRAGSMHYLHRNFASRADPSALMEGARSVVAVARNYRPPQCAGSVSPGADTLDLGTPEPVPGRVASYAWGGDYHLVMRRKLVPLARAVEAEGLADGVEAKARVCIDTAPILERELAAAAGLGWIGKNTLVLSPGLGSMFFLGSIVTTLCIEPDEPMPDHCGTCRRCLDACPTAAFPEPYQMDASRCISYLTIEHRGQIPRELQGGMQDWLFGCDICQEVCPFNHGAPPTNEAAFSPRDHAPALDAREVMRWAPVHYQARLRGTAMKRAKLDMLQRNAAIVIANRDASAWADPAPSPASP